MSMKPTTFSLNSITFWSIFVNILAEFFLSQDLGLCDDNPRGRAGGAAVLVIMH